MGMLDISIMQKYIRMANDGWLQGWHERNGGNLTYRLTADEISHASLPNLQIRQTAHAAPKERNQNQ